MYSLYDLFLLFKSNSHRSWYFRYNKKLQNAIDVFLLYNIIFIYYTLPLVSLLLSLVVPSKYLKGAVIICGIALKMAPSEK